MILREEYQRRYTEVLKPLAERLEGFIRDHFGGQPRIDRISARAKAVDRFLEKAAKQKEDSTAKYTDPLVQIQDQVGARIITFYKSDVERLRGEVAKYFRHVEQRAIVPDSPSQFGYEGHHFILFVPEDVIDDGEQNKGVPMFFELQIKTLFQHAWSEGEHDLAYKPRGAISIEQRRRFAFCAAQAWGADRVFEELFQEVGVSP